MLEVGRWALDVRRRSSGGVPSVVGADLDHGGEDVVDAVQQLADLLLALGCGDNLKASPDAAGDAPDTTALRHCIDSPGTIVQVPTNQLPCDLLPPGFGP